MTVKELIAELSEFDGDRTVYQFAMEDDGCEYCELSEIDDVEAFEQGIVIF